MGTHRLASHNSEHHEVACPPIRRSCCLPCRGGKGAAPCLCWVSLCWARLCWCLWLCWAPCCISLCTPCSCLCCCSCSYLCCCCSCSCCTSCLCCCCPSHCCCSLHSRKPVPGPGGVGQPERRLR